MADRARRTHAERSAATQQALLTATVECLAEVGYTGTTMSEVVRRAGLSRGAQVHHFPTKPALISAALHQLLGDLRARFSAAMLALPAESRTEEEGVALLWATFDGPSVRALAQVAVAGFADEALRVEVAEVLRELERVVVDEHRAQFATAARPGAEEQVLFAFRALIGAGFYRELGLGDEAESVAAMVGRLSRLVAPR